jgi:hypothetical protein
MISNLNSNLLSENKASFSNKTLWQLKILSFYVCLIVLYLNDLSAKSFPLLKSPKYNAIMA